MKTVMLIFSALAIGCCNAQTAKFEYQFDNIAGKTASFTLKDSNGKVVFTAKASAGYLGAANNPYFQATVNTGPLPNGTWEIYEMKSMDQIIFRLRPTGDVSMPVDGKGNPLRSGFLIHGTGKDKSPDESSTGCIILDRKYRKILYDYFKQAGIIKLTVTNIITGSDGSSG